MKLTPQDIVKTWLYMTCNPKYPLFVDFSTITRRNHGLIDENVIAEKQISTNVQQVSDDGGKWHK